MVRDTPICTDSITASKASNMTLTNSSLVAGTMSLGLSRHHQRQPDGDGQQRQSRLRRRRRRAFTGTTDLSATGTVAAVLFGGTGSGSVLSTTSSGNSILISSTG